MPEQLAHPAQIINALSDARHVSDDMIAKAEKRGDANGALAYRLLSVMISIVMQRADQVRSAQDWSRGPALPPE